MSWFDVQREQKTATMNEEFRLLQESTARLHFAIEWQASEAASRSSKSDAGNISKHL